MNTELQTTNRREPQARSGDGQDRDHRRSSCRRSTCTRTKPASPCWPTCRAFRATAWACASTAKAWSSRPPPSTAQPEGMQLVYGEAQFPSYRREFTLSRELDASRIEASLKDGVLRLAIPKLEEAKPRRIEVRVD